MAGDGMAGGDGMDHGGSDGMDHSGSGGMDHSGSDVMDQSGLTGGMDHGGSGGMDHGGSDGMDHSGSHGMDHSGSDGMDHGGSQGHGSSFYASRHSSILFAGANTTSVGGMIGAVIIVLIVSVLYEVLRRYQAYFNDPMGKNRCNCGDKSTVVEMRGAGKEQSHAEVSVDKPGPSTAAKTIQKMCTRHRTIYTAISITLHIISLTISYFLMLIAMTFNVWLFLAVILGSGLGKLVTMIFMDSTSEDTSQSHCNMP